MSVIKEDVHQLTKFIDNKGRKMFISQLLKNESFSS